MHDELVFEVRASRRDEVALLISDEMSRAWEAGGKRPPLAVPFPVEVNWGPSWGELQPLDLAPLRARARAAPLRAALGPKGGPAALPPAVGAGGRAAPGAAGPSVVAGQGAT